MSGPSLVLKVDVDTLEGTREGIPRLLSLFAKRGIRATFFFSLGPDNTGKAIKRVFRKGFVKKVLRSSPAASFGLKTMLYGTLLPAPDIGRDALALSRIREVRADGHECGIHAWDHVDWHDRARGLRREELDAIVSLAHTRFAEIFGERAVLSAAPGWTATPLSVEVQEAHGIRVTSDTRDGAPFHPVRADGRAAGVLEVPSTLPTLDELLAWDLFAGPSRREGTIAFLVEAVTKGAPGRAHVHSIHTEIEGGRSFHGLFERQLVALHGAGVRFATLGEIAHETLEMAGPIPARPLGFKTVKGRALEVATGFTGREGA